MGVVTCEICGLTFGCPACADDPELDEERLAAERNRSDWQSAAALVGYPGTFVNWQRLDDDERYEWRQKVSAWSKAQYEASVEAFITRERERDAEYREKLRRQGLRRKTPLRSGGPLERSPMKKKPAKRTDPSSVAVVKERSGGLCEAHASPDCTGRGEHVHHRVLVAHGRDDRPENLLHVCHVCHDAVHGSPERSYEAGWLVHPDRRAS